MTRSRVLYTSDDIHTEIKKLFGQPDRDDRRVALVAYVGGNAESYLPHPEGLRLICSPSAGGTDPDTLRRMIKRGARVEFSDGLHMKVYWSQKRGCVIGSANASSSALGLGGLKEAGVWLPPGTVDVEKLIKYARPRLLKEKELRSLDVRSREHRKNTRNVDRKARFADFLEWYDSPYHSAWKLVWAEEVVFGDAKAAKEQTLSEYGRREPYTWSCFEKGMAKPNEWLLSFFFTKNGVNSIEWQYVDFFVKVGSRDKIYDRNYPYHAVQVHSPSKYALPPFKITPQFRGAWNRAIKKYTPERIMKMKSYAPPVSLLKLVAEEMRGK
jgi:hypothetical protein